MGLREANGQRWGMEELSRWVLGELRPSSGLGTNPVSLTVPPSLFLVIVGFAVTLASCSKKRHWRDWSSACNPAGPSIPPVSPSMAPARSTGTPAPHKPFGVPWLPELWQEQPLTMFSRKAGTRVALGSTTKTSAELKRVPCKASGWQESRGCWRAQRCSSMGWSG